VNDAIDMKQMAVMSALVVMRLARRVRLTRDVIFAGVAARPAATSVQVSSTSARPRAPSTSGGFTVHLGGRELYPVAIAEGLVWTKLKLTGTPGTARCATTTVAPGALVHRLGPAPAATPDAC
jgi:hypothetical protein